MGDTDALRDKIAQAALDVLCPTNCNHRISSGGMMTDWNTGRVSINHTQGGPCAVHRSLSIILSRAVLPVVTQETAQALSLLRSRVEALVDELDDEVQAITNRDAGALGRRGALRDAAQRLRRSLSDNKEQQS